MRGWVVNYLGTIIQVPNLKVQDDEALFRGHVVDKWHWAVTLDHAKYLAEFHVQRLMAKLEGMGRYSELSHWRELLTRMRGEGLYEIERAE